MPSTSMTPDRFRACLDAAQWTPHGLARTLGMDERQARRWGAGTAAVPPAVARWLERVAAFHQANPPPAGGAQRTRPIPGSLEHRMRQEWVPRGSVAEELGITTGVARRLDAWGRHSGNVAEKRTHKDRRVSYRIRDAVAGEAGGVVEIGGE